MGLADRAPFCNATPFIFNTSPATSAKETPGAPRSPPPSTRILGAGLKAPRAAAAAQGPPSARPCWRGKPRRARHRGNSGTLPSAGRRGRRGRRHRGAPGESGDAEGPRRRGAREVAAGREPALPSCREALTAVSAPLPAARPGNTRPAGRGQRRHGRPAPAAAQLPAGGWGAAGGRRGGATPSPRGRAERGAARGVPFRLGLPFLVNGRLCYMPVRL